MKSVPEPVESSVLKAAFVGRRKRSLSPVPEPVESGSGAALAIQQMFGAGPA